MTKQIEVTFDSPDQRTELRNMKFKDLFNSEIQYGIYFSSQYKLSFYIIF